MATIALCQDCLRIIAHYNLIPDENDPPGRCPTCNGQTCDCEGCMGDMEHLLAGNLTSVSLQPGLRLTAWTAEDGGTVAAAIATPAQKE